MAFTTTQLAALEEAYAAGVLTVHHGNKTITYASMADLWAAIERLRAELASPKRLRASVCGYKRHA